MRTLGKTIAYYRKKKRISVIDLAEKLGVTRTAVYFWQRDKDMPRLSHLIELAKILEVPLTVFAASAEGKESVDADLAQLTEDQAVFWSKQFRDQISNIKKLQKS